VPACLSQRVRRQRKPKHSPPRELSKRQLVLSHCKVGESSEHAVSSVDKSAVHQSLPQQSRCAIASGVPVAATGLPTPEGAPHRIPADAVVFELGRRGSLKLFRVPAHKWSNSPPPSPAIKEIADSVRTLCAAYVPSYVEVHYPGSPCATPTSCCSTSVLAAPGCFRELLRQGGPHPHTFRTRTAQNRAPLRAQCQLKQFIVPTFVHLPFLHFGFACAAM
jgi:hypothetical protein